MRRDRGRVTLRDSQLAVNLGLPARPTATSRKSRTSQPSRGSLKPAGASPPRHPEAKTTLSRSHTGSERRRAPRSRTRPPREGKRWRCSGMCGPCPPPTPLPSRNRLRVIRPKPARCLQNSDQGYRQAAVSSRRLKGAVVIAAGVDDPEERTGLVPWARRRPGAGDLVARTFAGTRAGDPPPSKGLEVERGATGA